MCPLSRLDIADILEYTRNNQRGWQEGRAGERRAREGLGKGQHLLLGDIPTAVITTAYLTQRLHSRGIFSLSYTLLCLPSIGDKG